MRWIATPPGKGPDPTPKPVVVKSQPAPAASTPRPERIDAAQIKARRLKHSISRRINRMAMLVSMAGLAFAGLVFFACDIYAHYSHASASVATLGRIAAENVRTPLDLGYVQTATATLDAITSQPDITGAAVYRANGTLFARSARSDSALPAQLAGNFSGTTRDWPHLRHFVPIIQKGGRIGTVVIESTLAPLYRRLGVYGTIVAFTLALAWIAVRLLAGRLQPAISAPIVELAAVAEQVAKGRDYSIRAKKRADDEVGNLVDTFNRMLEEIERRDDDIDKARADLEINVLSRTSELHQQIEDRKKAQSALGESEHRYRNLFENNPMPMFVVDVETLKFIAVNNAAMRHYGYSEPEFMKLSLTTITLADPLEVVRTMRNPEKSMDAGEWMHRKRTGEVIEAHITAHSIVLVGRLAKIVLAQDVTQRNRAQREVEELHRQLVEASRQAGMAEIATGVLHNVGNVLNSVNVSASVLMEGTRESKAVSIRKVAELLNAHAQDLPALFAEGGKGRKLPQYLSALVEQIEQEQETRLAELESLTKNIEHIKEIVVTQQDYAKVTGVLANHEPRRLVEDALTIAELEFAQENIQVEISVQPGVPEVIADRHKVLQIFLNLFTNARPAMAQTPEDERKLSIRIDHEASRVRIAVADRGCGIPQENLTRIFNHGFTTKRSGHGFGLHTAANAATEMHGSLKADSSESGATFTLELPAGPPKKTKLSNLRK